MGNHALLSASSSHRWLNCPPSARLCEEYAATTSNYAQEGTDAHTLCTYKLQKALGIKTFNPTADLTYYNQEMEDIANDYVTFILELANVPGSKVMIEQRLDISDYIEGGFGTGDCIVVADKVLHIVDFKYGQGVMVESEDNTQMKLYALGALKMLDGIYDIDHVSMTIYQPRRSNITTHTLFKESLYQWAEDIVKPTAALAYAGGGEFSSGDWCKFCRAKVECRARAEENLKLVKFDFKPAALLDEDEIAEILGKIDNLVAWAADIKEHALQAALSGAQWQGWKLVESRSNRKYVDDKVVATVVELAGYDPYEHSVIGITAMEKLLGKAKFAELLGGYIEKPKGKPTLVPESDKRQAIEPAAKDFI